MYFRHLSFHSYIVRLLIPWHGDAGVYSNGIVKTHNTHPFLYTKAVRNDRCFHFFPIEKIGIVFFDNHFRQIHEDAVWRDSEKIIPDTKKRPAKIAGL